MMQEIVIGNLVRQERLKRGISQQQLAEPLGITFQQIQKYERGLNRISVSRLLEILKIFGMNTQEFFLKLEVPVEHIASDFSYIKEFLEFTPRVRKKLIQLVINLRDTIHTL